MNDYVIPFLTILFSTVGSAFAAWMVYRGQAERTPSQNFKDDMDTARIALEISEKSTAKQLELEKKVEKLEGILSNRRYKVTVVFSLGATPRIEEASIEAIQKHGTS